MNTFRNPVLLKELRTRMRGARAFAVLTVFLAILIAFTLLLYAIVRADVRNDPFGAGRTIGKVLFIGVALVALIQVMVIVPAQAAGALAGEKERETYDLLIATLLSPWQIVLGKLLAALAYAVLLIVAVLPLMALAFFFGGVTGTELVIALLGMLATALLYGSLGILWSTIAHRTLTATILTQATNVAMLMGIPFLMFAFATLVLTGPRPPDWVASYPFVYAAGSLVAMHPLIALGGADVLLSQGETRWFFPVPGLAPPQGPIYMPAPWLAYLIASVVVSGLLLWIATRMVRHTYHAPAPPRTTPPTVAQPAPR